MIMWNGLGDYVKWLFQILDDYFNFLKWLFDLYVIISFDYVVWLYGSLWLFVEIAGAPGVEIAGAPGKAPSKVLAPILDGPFALAQVGPAPYRTNSPDPAFKCRPARPQYNFQPPPKGGLPGASTVFGSY